MPVNKYDGNKGPLDLFHPKVSSWFLDNIGKPTPIQEKAWDSIRKGEDVLVASPTGTGKTLAAVLPGIDAVVSGDIPRDNVIILYISPMKALGADLVRSLTDLSGSIGRVPGKPDYRGRGRKPREDRSDSMVQIGIRTGDVPQSDRRRMLKYPPDLLITTPENLLLMLCSKAREILANVRYVVIDEVHEMVGSKRGALLSLNLEQLNNLITSNGSPLPIRIGLSATIKPLSRAARYVGGQDGRGKARPVNIVHRAGEKKIKIMVRTLMDGWGEDPEVIQRITVDIGSILKKKEGSIVVFHNTRARAEEMAYALIHNEERSVAPHHGSLGVDVRREAEEGLKRGELEGVISSTSLELGIDIGRVKEVYQISSPKDPSRMLQRFGRSGHGMGETSVGVIYPTSGSDLLESVATVNAAIDGDLDPLISPKGPFDVLAQFAIGLSISDLEVNERVLFHLARGAFPYKNIRMRDVKAILSLLSERLRIVHQPPPRLWKDEHGNFLPRRGTRQAFYLNCGTIPRENRYWVVEERSKRRIGDLSRDFGEALYEGDVILLGSRSYRVRSFTGSKISVREEPEAAPTVPSWSGEVKPRPINVGRRIYEIYSRGKGSVENVGGGWIELTIDDKGKNILKDLIEHQRASSLLPARDKIPVERVRSRRGRTIYIFHLPLGLKVTEPLGRVLSYGIRRGIGARVDYTASDDGFAVSSPTPLNKEDIVRFFGGREFGQLALRLIFTSSIFRSRFTHCLMKSLLVLNRFRGRETGSTYRRKRVEKLIELMRETYHGGEMAGAPEDPLTGLHLLGDEAIKEVLSEKVDLGCAEEIVKDLERGTELMILPEADVPNVIGSGIIRGWRQEVSDLDRGADPSGMEKGEDDEKKSKIVLDDHRLKFRDMTLALISGMIDNVIDPQKIAMENDISVTRSEDELRSMAEKGELIEIEAGGWKKYMPLPEDLSDISFPFDVNDIVSHRMRAGMGQGKGQGAILRSLPFFTHPLELMSRLENMKFDDLRSAVKGGAIVPYFALGDRRAGHPRWGRIFALLSQRPPEIPDELMAILNKGKIISRGSISEAAELKGEPLTKLIRELKRSNVLGQFGPEAVDLIGASDDMIVTHTPPFDGEERTQAEMEAICKFLDRFGPFTLKELSRLFNWEGGFYPPGVISAVSDGRITLCPGPGGPMEPGAGRSGDMLSIWLTPDEWAGVRSDHTFPDGLMVLPETDPCLLITGQAPSWIERGRVRGARSTRFVSIRNGTYNGLAQVLEMKDLIRVLDLEVQDFQDLEANTSAFMKAISGYERLGFEVFLLEKIMGIPAGEAAITSVARSKEMDFKEHETPSGVQLLRGVEAVENVKNRILFERMFHNQGLSGSNRPGHPLEVIMKLGGVSDRWELLSRLGTPRHRRVDTNKVEMVGEIMRDDAENSISSIRGGRRRKDVDWSDLTLLWNERLPDINDLTKKYGLYKAMLDQPLPVWSTKDLISTFYPHIKSFISLLNDDLVRGLAGVVSRYDERGGPGVDVDKKDLTGLVRAGLLIEDAWGMFRRPFWNLEGGTEKERGIHQRAWVLRAAKNLGTFTYQDLIEHSPSICDGAKFRMLLNELTGEHIQRRMTFGPGPQIIYSTEGDLIWERINEGSPPEIGGHLSCKEEEEGNADDDLMVLSPRDRMNRVSRRYVKDYIPKGKGYLIFKNGIPIAALSMRRAQQRSGQSEVNEGLVGTSSMTNWTITSFSHDLRKRRKDVIRDVKKAFFSLGLTLLSESEEDTVDSLYKDADLLSEMR